MADTTTTTYGLTKPEVGASEDTWGTKINTNLDAIDDLLDGTTAVTGIDINSGSIDGTPIGSTSASTGAFTTLSASGAATFNSSATFANIDVNGGSIDGAPIGANSASTGAFTTLSASGAATLNGSATFNSSATFASAATFNDSETLRFGTGGDTEMFSNGTNMYMDVNGGGIFYIRDGNSSNATRFTFDVDNGNFTAGGNVTAYSDARLKSDIKTIEGALGKVLKMRGVSYIKDGTPSVGVIAQEMAEVLPEVVAQGDSGYLSVAYGNIVGVLIEAVKELSEKVERLEAGKEG